MGSRILRLFWWSAVLTLASLASCTSSTTRTTTSAHHMANDAGFSSAYFGATDLRTAMRDPICARVRFYNARRSKWDTRGSVIMIGVRADTSELDNLPYRLYDKVIYGMTATFSLNKEEARQCCLYIPANQASYCSEFTKGEINRMLSVNGCGGIQLVPVQLASGYWSMRMSPVQFNNNMATVITTGGFFVDSEPCPNHCGSQRFYVNR